MHFDGHMNWYFGEIGQRSEQTIEVGRFPSNPWGLFDCHGNIEEWCLDQYTADFYRQTRGVDPQCQTGESSWWIMRGGAWDDHPADCRATARNWGVQGKRDSDLGFRVAFRLT